MTRPPPRSIRPTTVVALVALVASACGSQSDEPSATDAPSTSRPAAVAGSELDGVRVDVRRDPG